MDLNLNIDLTGQDKTDAPKIPLIHPKFNASYKLAIIGETPHEDDFVSGQPFTSGIGNFLTSALGAVGIQKSVCFLGYLNQYKGRFGLNSPETQDSLNDLRKELQVFQPNMIILLGQKCMNAGGFGLDIKADAMNKMRGSLLQCLDATSPFFTFKCLATYDPYEIMTKWQNQPLWSSDLQRAKEDGEFKELRLPQRKFELRPTVDYICSEFERFRRDKCRVALDIEGVVPNITCCSFTDKPLEGFIVVFNEFKEWDLKRILKSMSLMLFDTGVEKVLQNGVYDAGGLAQCFNMLIRNIKHDTMFAAWELAPELRKGLGVLCSYLTREPYYKDDRTKDDRNTHAEYCCKDSAVTLEIQGKQESMLKGTSLEHYKFNMDMIRPTLYMMLRGIKYDHEAAKESAAICQLKADEIQERLDRLYCKDANKETGTLNVNSPKQVCIYLYDIKGFPVQHPKKKTGRGLDTTKRTSDESACLELFKQFADPVVIIILALRRKLKEKTFCEIKYDVDGRIRSSYNVVGTVTGRMSSSKTAAGTGFNLTTIPKQFRKFYKADEGNYFYQCDLAGADGWTVAAHCLQMGDPTMYEDYMYGLKPAKIIALLHLYGKEVNSWSRDKLKDESKAINEDGPGGWLYFTCKRAQHASCYLVGGKQMSATILSDSYKKDGKLLNVTPLQCKTLQDLFMRVRYVGILSWQNKIKTIVTQSRGYPELPCASGHVRKFFGKPRDHSTLREACAHEPQANTTYATNLAALNLWNDPENRNGDGSLIIEPQHQVHDALCGQFPIEKTEWAVSKLKSYFNNTLSIAGMDVVIPFDGFYAPSWGECAEDKMTGEI